MSDETPYNTLRDLFDRVRQGDCTDRTACEILGGDVDTPLSSVVVLHPRQHVIEPTTPDLPNGLDFIANDSHESEYVVVASGPVIAHDA